jgi:hypothetical protein
MAREDFIRVLTYIKLSANSTLKADYFNFYSTTQEKIQNMLFSTFRLEAVSIIGAAEA